MEVQDGTNLFVNPAERNWQPHQIPSSGKRIHGEGHSERYGLRKSTGGLQVDLRQVPAKSGQLSHFKQIIKHKH